MPAPERSRILCIVDGFLNSVPVCDLDQEELKQLMAAN